MQNLQIIKKDNTLEEWSQDKLIASLTRAGIPAHDATEIAGRIHSWAIESAIDNKVMSTKIRDKVIQEIVTAYPAEADSYQAFQKG